jgi:hypothetical protein
LVKGICDSSENVQRGEGLVAGPQEAVRQLLARVVVESGPRASRRSNGGGRAPLVFA